MIQRILIAVVLATCAFSIHAADRFTIERIEIRNAQVLAPEVLAAETLLREGREVSEEDVRAGARRLVRLHFVLEADYALEPAGDPSRRVVVITVTENRRLWLLLDGRFMQTHVPVDALDYAFPDQTSHWKHAAVGARWRFRDGSEAHFAMTVLRNRFPLGKNYSADELGYTRRQILGTPLFATVIVRSPVDSIDESTFTPEVVIGLPLTASQTVAVEFEETSFVEGTRLLFDTEFSELHSERRVAAWWALDTTDEPYTTMSGTFVKVEPFVWMSDQNSVRQRPPRFQFEAVSRHATGIGVDLTAERHWQLSDVGSFSAGVNAGWATLRLTENPAVVAAEERRRPSFEVLQVGYARRIWRSHVEVEGRLVLRQEDSDPTGYEGSISWARRYRRGMLRLGFAYTD